MILKKAAMVSGWEYLPNPFDDYSTITFSLPIVCRLEAVRPSGRCLFSDGFPYQVHHRLVIDTAVSGEPYLTGAAVGVSR